ncbi:MAG: hypothetical protein MZV63_19895 [Marinilabiliales bacterium]|nr:hypothetical protein [Marinilabiliales bacterium]
MLPQRDRAVRLAVAERRVERGVEIESHRDQLAQRHRADAALAHVMLGRGSPTSTASAPSRTRGFS